VIMKCMAGIKLLLQVQPCKRRACRLWPGVERLLDRGTSRKPSSRPPSADRTFAHLILNNIGEHNEFLSVGMAWVGHHDFFKLEEVSNHTPHG
jgi:hypothetical protein